MISLIHVDFFDHSAYMREQVIIALTCPLNRWATKVEWSQKLRRPVDDNDLFQNPQWLVDHFIQYGGAEAFAKRRPEFVRKKKVEVVVPDPDPEYWI